VTQSQLKVVKQSQLKVVKQSQLKVVKQSLPKAPATKEPPVRFAFAPMRCTKRAGQ